MQVSMMADPLKLITGNMHIQKPVRILLWEFNCNRIGPSPYSFIITICVVYMNVFAGFDTIPSMTLQDIKEI